MNDSMQRSPCQEASQTGCEWRTRNHEDDGDPTWRRSRTAWKSVACRSRVGWMLRVVCAAAAIVASSAWLLWAHRTSGITFAQIATACDGVGNVHVTRRNPPTGEVIQELWISHEMNALAMTTAQGYALYDLSTRRKRCVDPTFGQMESGPLSDQEYFGARAIAATYPSRMLTDAPSDAKWSHVRTEGDSEVYQLTQTRPDSIGLSYLVRFELTIDGATRLPRAFRLFHSAPATTGWECMSESLFEYPAGTRMKALLEDACY